MGRKRNHDAQVSARSRGDSWTGRSEEKRISDEWARRKKHCYRNPELISMHLIHGTNNSTGTDASVLYSRVPTRRIPALAVLACPYNRWSKTGCFDTRMIDIGVQRIKRTRWLVEGILSKVGKYSVHCSMLSTRCIVVLIRVLQQLAASSNICLKTCYETHTLFCNVL